MEEKRREEKRREEKRREEGRQAGEGKARGGREGEGNTQKFSATPICLAEALPNKAIFRVDS